MLYPGCVYVTGNIQNYIISYFGVDPSLTAQILPCFFVGGCLLMPIGTYFIQKNTHPKLIVGIPATLSLAFLTGAALCGPNQFWVFFICYVIGFSIIQGSVYMLAVHHCWLWFTGSPGLVSGIIIGGYGLGALIFDQVTTLVINPYHDTFDKETNSFKQEVNDRFRMMLLTEIACFAVFAIVGFFCIFEGPKQPVSTQQ